MALEEFDRDLEKSLKDDLNTPALTAVHFVLVHGIGGGAWCWYKIRCLMENSGYKVTCLDLKGAGVDPTDPNTILSFQDYNKPLIDFLSSLPHNEQVILVGHSAGGLSLCDAIHKFGKERIKLAVFVAATMLKSGFMTDQDIKDVRYGEMNELYNMEFGLGESYPPTSVTLKKEVQRSIIYQLSPQQDLTLAAMLVRPGPPIQATRNAKFGGGDKVDEVPRIYIKTMQDKLLKLEQQEAMIEKWQPSDVYCLESDHSPFFSAPFQLFGLLVKAALSFGYN